MRRATRLISEPERYDGDNYVRPYDRKRKGTRHPNLAMLFAQTEHELCHCRRPAQCPFFPTTLETFSRLTCHLAPGMFSRTVAGSTLQSCDRVGLTFIYSCTLPIRVLLCTKPQQILKVGVDIDCNKRARKTNDRDTEH